MTPREPRPVDKSRSSLGAYGEDRSCEWYERNGYSIVERNWRCAEGEIDVIARSGATLVICEVKTRSSDRFGTAAEAVTPAKQRKLRRLAQIYLSSLDEYFTEVRFDVAACTSGRVEMITAAF